MKAKQRRHADEVVKIEEVVSRLVSPEHGVEEIRGIESEEGEDDQSEEEDKEKDDIEEEVLGDRGQAKKNKRKRENKRVDKEKMREQEDAFKAQIVEYQGEMAKDKEDNDSLSQTVRGVEEEGEE